VLDIDQPRVVAAATDPAVIDKLSRLRFKYVGLVPTDRFASRVATALGEPVGDVRPRIGATAVPTDLLIRVQGRGDSAEEAKRTADAAATALTELVSTEQSDDGIPAAQRVEVELVDAAGTPQRVGGRAGSLVAALLAGLIAAVAVLAVTVRRQQPDAPAA
jgi:hypothetical protein